MQSLIRWAHLSITTVFVCQAIDEHVHTGKPTDESSSIEHLDYFAGSFAECEDLEWNSDHLRVKHISENISNLASEISRGFSTLPHFFWYHLWNPWKDGLNITYKDRLKYSSLKMSGELLQERIEPEDNLCPFEVHFRRLRLLHKAASLLLLGLPQSSEDIQEAMLEDFVEDYLFRPQARQIFTLPCLECYKMHRGECREIFFCKNGKNVHEHFYSKWHLLPPRPLPPEG